MTFNVTNIKRVLNIVIGVGFFAGIDTFVPGWFRPCFGICYSQHDISSHIVIAVIILSAGIVFRMGISFFESKSIIK